MYKMTADEFRDMVDDSMGFCTICQDWTRSCTEPDVSVGDEGYDCPECQGTTVVGAENALIEGLLDITE